MRQNTLEEVKRLILRSGVGTITQRKAICQRLQDHYDEQRRLGRKYGGEDHPTDPSHGTTL